ncbi:MAG: hypothetical protein EAY75_14710 [Bacteroidetes bacterium]|nr:MAG: hypothetical protein EAY75_14710 [Bacteroidota bacterium]
MKDIRGHVSWQNRLLVISLKQHLNSAYIHSSKWVTMTKTSFFTKFITLLFAFVGIANAASMLAELLPPAWVAANEYWLEIIFLVVEIALPLVLALVLAILWHRQAHNTRKAQKRYHLLLAVVRYWLAFEICAYGFAKILGTQFHTPVYRLDIPLGDVNGFGLTWYYFGYSRALALIIAVLQIGGSILLMFRRTTLLGCFILLPIMVNILCINAFYSIAVGAFINSTLFTLALLFLLWWYRQTLRQWLLTPLLQAHQGVRNWWPWVLRVAVLVASFLFIQSFLWGNNADKKLQGKWEVKTYINNGDTMQPDDWLHDTTAWKVLYFDGFRGQAAFCPNPFCYVPSQSAKGSYKYNTATNGLTATFLNYKNAPYDSIEANVAIVADTLLTLKGKHANKPFEMVAKRVKR